MSTTKPRITITLEEATALRLRRVSELTGNSQSALVAEVLEQAGEVFDRLILVLEAAQQAKSKLSKSSIEGLELAQRRIEKQLGLALDDFHEATAPLFEAEKVQRRARKGAPLAGVGFAPEAAPEAPKKAARKAPQKQAPAPLPTPISNRGVRSTHTPKKVIAQNDRPERLSRESAPKKRVKKTGV
jgi:hypothetical protein